MNWEISVEDLTNGMRELLETSVSRYFYFVGLWRKFSRPFFFEIEAPQISICVTVTLQDCMRMGKVSYHTIFSYYDNRQQSSLIIIEYSLYRSKCVPWLNLRVHAMTLDFLAGRFPLNTPHALLHYRNTICFGPWILRSTIWEHGKHENQHVFTF